MVFSRIIFSLLFVALYSVLAQRPSLDQSLPDLPTERLRDQPIGYDFPKPGEEKGDATRDLDFDMEITTEDNTASPRLPTIEEARRVYDSQIDQVASEAEKAGDDTLKMRRNSRASINPVFQYYSLEAWQNPILRCCPRSWNYQCRSSNVRLPCFSHYYGGVREWCCPIWPSVFVKRCMCSQCAVLTSTCAHEGRCQRLYSRRSFLAVCYRNNQWGNLRYITKYLPSSCYCRI